MQNVFSKVFMVVVVLTATLFFGCSKEKPTASNDPIMSIYSDAAIYAYGNYVYVLEKNGADNVLKYNTSSISTSTNTKLFILGSDYLSGILEWSDGVDMPINAPRSGVVYQIHLGDNWNPQSIKFVSETKAYICNLDEPKITVFNPSNGSVIKNIDISSFTYRPDSNNSPYANAMEIVGSDLYVMLQRRNGWNPGAATMLLKVNTSTDSILDSIALQYKNGHSMAYYNGSMYVSNPGSFFNADGAIEKVVLSTKSVTTVITETDLGGKPNQIVHKSGNVFYVQNYIGWKDVKVVELDASTGTVSVTLPGVKDGFGGIYYDSVASRLYVGERDTTEMGVRVFENNIQVGATIKSSASLPPNGMIVVR